MRILSMIFASLLLGGVMAAQAPAAKPAAQAGATKPAQEPAAKPEAALPAPHVGGTLAQIMRANLFHNSNLLFAAQTADPADPQKPLDASFGIFAKVYYGWPVIENAAIAMIEAPDWILKPGRFCSNGRPVPVERPDFRKFAEDLATAGRFALKAAQSKNMANMVEAGSKVSDACGTCHHVYRDNPDLDDLAVPKELFEATLRKQTASRCAGYVVN
jgi:cytochrome c553